MDPNTVSLLTSIIAIALSAAAFGWTVYRDVIQRPRFRVSISLKSVVQQGREPIGPDIYLEALNMGPLSNRIGLPFARPSWFGWKFRKEQSAFIAPDYGHMAATKSGQRIDVGDTATFVFPYNKNCFLKDHFVHIGVTDGYGRTHWASRKQLREVRAKFRAEFPTDGTDLATDDE